LGLAVTGEVNSGVVVLVLALISVHSVGSLSEDPVQHGNVGVEIVTLLLASLVLLLTIRVSSLLASNSSVLAHHNNGK